MQVITEFIAMGGYGVYVWSALGICIVTLGLNFYLPFRAEKILLRKLRLLESSDK